MIGPPERAACEQIALLRSVGYAAFGRNERDLDVLDLTIEEPPIEDVIETVFAQPAS